MNIKKISLIIICVFLLGSASVPSAYAVFGPSKAERRAKVITAKRDLNKKLGELEYELVIIKGLLTSIEFVPSADIQSASENLFAFVEEGRVLQMMIANMLANEKYKNAAVAQLEEEVTAFINSSAQFRFAVLGRLATRLPLTAP